MLDIVHFERGALRPGNEEYPPTPAEWSSMRTATLDRPDTLTSSRNQRCAGSVSAVMRMVPEGLSLSSLRAASSSSISSRRGPTLYNSRSRSFRVTPASDHSGRGQIIFTKIESRPGFQAVNLAWNHALWPIPGNGLDVTLGLLARRYPS